MRLLSSGRGGGEGEGGGLMHILLNETNMTEGEVTHTCGLVHPLLVRLLIKQPLFPALLLRLIFLCSQPVVVTRCPSRVQVDDQPSGVFPSQSETQLAGGGSSSDEKPIVLDASKSKQSSYIIQISVVFPHCSSSCSIRVDELTLTETCVGFTQSQNVS